MSEEDDLPLFSYRGALSREDIDKKLSELKDSLVVINNEKDLEKYSKNDVLSSIGKKKNKRMKFKKSDPKRIEKLLSIDLVDDEEEEDKFGDLDQRFQRYKTEELDLSKLIEEKTLKNSQTLDISHETQRLDKKLQETQKEMNTLKKLTSEIKLDLTDEKESQSRSERKRILELNLEDDFEDENALISIKISHPTESEFTEEFEIKMKENFKSIFQSYQEKYRIFKEEVKYKYEGIPIKEEKTPKHYAMKNGDVILAHFFAVKSSSSQIQNKNNESEEDGDEKIKITFRSKKEEEVINVTKTKTFKEIKDSYMKAKKLKAKLKFLFDGLELKPNSTPEQEDMDDGDIIDIK